jgi:predicted lipid-binding transport protein (Tim44 family)
MCHPDKVGDEFKDAAEKIFVDLKAAYEENDLNKVSEILNNLEKGNFFKAMSDTISEKEKLIAASAKLRMQIKTLENEIVTIKQSETYKTIINIDDWDAYFKKTKELLEQELQELKAEIDE